MQTNKEHVRARAFLGRRLVAAVVSGRPDGWERPLGRTSTGTAIGLVLAVVLVLGFVVYGWIRPGSGPTLAGDTSVVVEKETGTRYVVDRGALRPVANLASALLLAGPELKVQRLSRARTAQLPRGTPVGVIGAPDDVPTASGVVASGWSACLSAPAVASRAVADPPLTLSFGAGPVPRPLGATDAVLVQGPDGDVHLVSDGVRYGLDSVAARTALGYAVTEPVRVPQAWLAALPPGRALTPVDLPGGGSPGPVLTGVSGQVPTQVGRVLVVRTPLGDPQYFVAEARAVVAVTEVEARLVLGNPSLAAVNPGGFPQGVPEVMVAGALRARWQQAQGWPARVPRPVEPHGQDVCVAAGASGPAWVGTAPTAPRATASAGPDVRVPPGSAVVAEVGEPGGSASGVISLVDDLGRRYELADDDTLAALGLATAVRLRVPLGLLAVVPTGPSLDVALVRPRP